MLRRTPLETQRALPTLALAFVLLTVPFGAAVAASDTTSSGECALDRTAETVAGLQGAGLDGTSSYVEADIPTACWGQPFTLAGQNPGDDFDVCWHDAGGAELQCFAATGDETGAVPEGSAEARILYYSGVDGGYRLVAGSYAAPLRLYFEHAPTPSGNANGVFVGGNPMSPAKPTGDVPAVWYSIPVIADGTANGFYNAAWAWEPAGGFAYEHEDVTITFYALSAGTPLGTGGWGVQLYADSRLVAQHEPGDLDPVDSATADEYQVTFEDLTFSGDSLQVYINPQYVNTDWPHVLLYDSAATPAGIQIGTFGDDTTPPSQVQDVTVDDAASTSLALAWPAATDDSGVVAGYNVYRGTSAADLAFVGKTATTTFTDGGLAPDTSYFYAVSAVDGAGNEGVNSTAIEARTEAPSTTRTFYFHDVGGARSMNELDSSGDVSGSGYNVLGSASATVEYHTGSTVLGTRHVFPASSPANDPLATDPSRNVTATVYVQTDVSPVAVQQFELSLYGSADEVLARGTALATPTSDAWTPVTFDLSVADAVVARGDLRAEFRLVAGTAGYVVGYEGDHASSVSLPVPLIGPLTVEAAITSPGPFVEDVRMDFSAAASGGIAPYTYEWDFGESPGLSTAHAPGAVKNAGATGPTAQHKFMLPGRKTVTVTATDAAGETATSVLSMRVLQTDFVGEARVVVAVIDSGINPYHTVFRRPDAQLPLDEFVDATTGNAPRVVNLTLDGTYSNNVAADASTFAGISTRELVWFNHTNVLGVSMGNSGTSILDDPDDGHGTATSSTVLDAWPDAIIVMVENDNLLFSNGIPNAFAWAEAQPWIDVVSSSLGVDGNAPEPLFLYQAPAIQRAAWQDGKLWANSAGNDPSPVLTDGLDGSPWAISVAGTQEGGEGREVMSSTVYPDVASNYTVNAATHTSMAGRDSISGTSFSCPTVAGTLAGAIHQLRRDAGHTGGIVDGELAPGVTNEDIRNAMNKTATYHPYDGYVAGVHALVDVAVLPVAPWLEVGWGHVDARIIDDIVDVVQSGDYSLPGPTEAKGQAAIYMEAQITTRRTYWNDVVTSFFA